MPKRTTQHSPEHYLTPADDPLLGLHFADCDGDLEKIKRERRKGGYRVRCACKATVFLPDKRKG